MREDFGYKSVDDNWKGFNVHSFLQVGSGGASGIITDGSETLV